jgi:cytochrome c oxidase subunit 2
MAPSNPFRRPLGWTAAFVFLALALGAWLTGPTIGQEGPARHDFSITAGNFRYDPARLVVRRDDLVKISFRATDIAHSFTIDAYRIAKRAAGGQTVVFEFRADRTGTFPIYCNLTLDERCKEMHGELVVLDR